MKRKTEEVEIEVELGKDGEIDTDDEVLDHLLRSLMFYMDMEANIYAKWDLRHHLWEDLAITLGKEINKKIEREEINRFGDIVMPMDDALVLVAVDISRTYVDIDLDIKEEEKDFDLTLVKEFIKALSRTIEATIHIKQISGSNGHHIIEAVFKGFGVALGQALKESEELKSTKGVL